VSELTEGYIGHPSEVSRVGEELEVKVLKLDRRKRQINLSVKATETVEMPAEVLEDELPATAMELALREAMEGQSSRRAERLKRRQSHEQEEREEIFARTLRHHRERED